MGAGLLDDCRDQAVRIVFEVEIHWVRLRVGGFRGLEKQKTRRFAGAGIIGLLNRTQRRDDRSGEPGASPSSKAANARKSRENVYPAPVEWQALLLSRPLGLVIPSVAGLFSADIL